jgi:branched-chain amino acid transport system substrate-binding protein
LSTSKALTKIQAIILVAIIVVAVSGGIIYFSFNPDQSSETIKIGILGDLDAYLGKAFYQGAVLAAEQINAEGGVLGRNFEIIAEDDDSETGQDMAIATLAFNKLIASNKVDFVISPSFHSGSTYLELIAQHKIILIGSGNDVAAQRVLENYEKYKYFFRHSTNTTIGIMSTIQAFLHCREYTGFNKVGFLYENSLKGFISTITNFLADNGFELVYNSGIPSNTVDYSSYFAQAEAAGVEILYPYIVGTASIPFVREYYDRQSPMVMWGMITMAQRSDFWEITEGKCEHTTNNGMPIVTGYPFTNKTIPTREAYVERWGEAILSPSAMGYDIVRFVLPEAIELAGITETEAVIKALETIEIETSSQRNFAFSSSHEILVSLGGTGRVCMFQWQNGIQVPLWPKNIMEEAGANYTFPDWPGPWDNLD